MLKGSTIPLGVLGYLENSMSWQGKCSLTEFSYHFMYFTGLRELDLLTCFTNLHQNKTRCHLNR